MKQADIVPFCRALGAGRRAKGWTQEDVASELGISRKTYILLESARWLPSPRQRAHFVRVLHRMNPPAAEHLARLFGETLADYVEAPVQPAPTVAPLLDAKYARLVFDSAVLGAAEELDTSPRILRPLMSKATTLRRASWAVVLFGASACVASSSQPIAPTEDAALPSEDAGTADAAPTPDAGGDATLRAEAGTDAALGSDSTVAGDAGTDADAASATDATPDAQPDAQPDSGADSGEDAGEDASPDAPFCSNGCVATSIAIFGDSNYPSYGNSACALLTDHTVACWGAYMPPFVQGSATPFPIPGITGATSVAVGYDALCAVLENGTVQCLGQNSSGELGDNRSTTNPPAPVTGLTSVSAVALGQTFACALAGAGGTVSCWGSNAYTELGSGTDAGVSYVPVAVPGISGAVAVAAGEVHTCALIGDGGTVSCWGSGGGGQLDNGTNLNPVPVQIAGISGAVTITASTDETCVVIGDGGVTCWGDGMYDDLGNSSSFAFSEQPWPVQGLGGAAAAVAVGAYHACALLSGGTVSCWGADNYGELGDGTIDASVLAQPVPGLSGVTQVAIGSTSACAVIVDGGVVCWGSNASGQLGNGSADAGPSVTPVSVVWP